ncbi:hypothetical protein TCAL_07690 [Tigriopus californicus]|uniref:DNA primase n=1 Tax=Tigriopus californicus TaxID=6832 RepID=A0A553NDA7_TIGCA|nr:DNA primase small subunit-like [Tigriopus californicus]TRY63432.1 hypothetical protein TCAL_07690 [Tigriopus californicus]|eukprot:TCALIF_07690-PA protein Name:"Similar to PRIM1 DNA primase small subunit (Homo sapiens)" AED:0.04 eAED:0.04 QI:151/1/1/1/1/1/4/715/407
MSHFEDLLKIYYKRLFPYEPYIKWLGGVDRNYLSKREFSFTLQDDIYLRYLSFSTEQEFRTELIKRNPVKIDIGAVFTSPPSQARNDSKFQPQEKEIVFDIDMTDYDDVRSCCSGAEICPKCWKFMILAVKILDRALRRDFGFQYLLWVYSGRRGIHCWVSDPAARKLGQSARSAVAEYLQLVTGGDSKAKKVHLPVKVHPSIERALQIMKGEDKSDKMRRNYFQEICLVDQDIMGTTEEENKVLALISKADIRESVKQSFAKCKTSIQKWDNLVAITRGCNDLKTANVSSEIMLQYAYPRLDINVSKGLNHLLKSPFCVHPKTGRVCVPINPEKIDQFDPFTVPTLEQLTEEINQFALEEGDRVIKKEYKKTSLREPISLFENYLSTLSQTWKGKLIAESDSQGDF